MTQELEIFQNWIASRGWTLHSHQQAMLDVADEEATVLIAPTGGGKTLAGFLPTLIELGADPEPGLHTIYVSPLKALATDIKRNLETPISGMGLNIRVEDRTGDTSYTKKRRQRADPPHILLTTPESLALLTSYDDAARTFAGVSRIIVDEIHALSESKRGDQLMLALARIQTLCPGIRRVGLSATVENPDEIGRFLSRKDRACRILNADPGPDPDISMLATQEPPPWAGGGGAYAIGDVLAQVKKHKTTLIFHNTRAQAEIFFHNLWLANTDDLPIGIHHGSLARVQREKVEQAMVNGALRAIVCTGSLDLGIDWGDVDLVIQIGAPKNVKRLVQRIGRANHNYNAPSKAILVPANRFEVIECQAALDAVYAHDLDGDGRGAGPRDVLCQHILIAACSGPFNADDLFLEMSGTGAFGDLSRVQFDACLEFCATGGYALRKYDRWQKLMQNSDEHWMLRDPRLATSIRMNMGTIQDTDTLKVFMRGQRDRPLGEIEEGFAATLAPGDTFLIGGRVVKFHSLKEMTVQVTRDARKKPKVATFMGTKFATSTQLSHRILALYEAGDFDRLPPHTRNWLALQKQVSKFPAKDRMLVESFPHGGREHTVFYGYAGRNAMQTLGLLLTKRMEDAGLAPLGFVATDYALMIWGLDRVTEPAKLLASGDLRSDFEAWLSGNALMKRTFRNVATIAGLIERNLPQNKRTGRQAMFSSDILYDTLSKYDPDHVLLDITREEAMKGLIDFSRIEEMLGRINGKIDHIVLDRVTPFAAPMLLEVGKVSVKGAAEERLLAEETAELMALSGLNKISI